MMLRCLSRMALLGTLLAIGLGFQPMAARAASANASTTTVDYSLTASSPIAVPGANISGPQVVALITPTGKSSVQLVDLPAQHCAFLLKFQLAPGQCATKPLGFGRVCLAQGGHVLQLIELRGKLAVALMKLLDKLVPQSLVFLAILFVFRSEAIIVAAELLELGQECFPLRLDSRVILLEGFQPGTQLLVFLANCRKLAGQLRPLVRRTRLDSGGPGPFRLIVKLVAEISSRVRVPDLCGHFLDLLDEELVVTLMAPGILAGHIFGHPQSSRAIGADHVDMLALGTRSAQWTGLVFLGARRHRMVGREGAELVLAMLAAHVAAAVGDPDSQGDQTVGTNRHKVRGRLAHGHLPRAGKSKELKPRIGSRSWWTISPLDLFRKPREFQPAFILPAPACPKNRHDSSNPHRHLGGNRARELFDPRRGRVAEGQSSGHE